MLDASHPDPDESEPLATALRTIDRKFLERWFGEFLKQSEGYATASPQDFRPAHFEVAFGPARIQDRTDPLNTADAWDEYLEGERLRIAGQVDRIDLGRVGDQMIFGIVDYKTGRAKAFKADDFADGLRLQLPLYALVTERLLLKRHDAIAWQMGYWSVKENKVVPYRLAEIRDGAVAPTDAWVEQRQTLLSRLAALARGIRRGEFPMANPDENCGAYCEFKTICRVNHARALEKQWTPPTQAAEVIEEGDGEIDEGYSLEG
ncbi:MAG: PD-(D/E)XK nuclease family protein [Pirellulales bacterium]